MLKFGKGIRATDGHAKDFSVRLHSDGRSRLTPPYNVISAQPSLDAGQIQRETMKLAMAAVSNRKYLVDEIVPRHFRRQPSAPG